MLKNNLDKMMIFFKKIKFIINKLTNLNNIQFLTLDTNSEIFKMII